MKVAFVDTSCLVAIAFGEPGAKAMQRRLSTFDMLFATSLLEAELMAACVRERVTAPSTAALSWVTPTRRLTAELARVLETGYVRGAAAWHLASALYLAPDPGELSFLSLDLAQTKVAKALGFRA